VPHLRRLRYARRVRRTFATAIVAVLVAGCSSLRGGQAIRFETATPGAPLAIDATLVLPSGPAPFPAVVQLHGCAGVEAQSFRWARWLADHGYRSTIEYLVAMCRLVFDGVYDRHPKLKIITHHLGGTVPFLESRIKNAYDQFGTRTADEDYGALLRTLKKHPHEYYRMFYADTALYGSPPALECGLAFFGAEHVLFGSDMPFDAEGGSRYIRQTLRAIEEMTASPQEKQRILRENAVRLLGLEPRGR